MEAVEIDAAAGELNLKPSTENLKGSLPLLLLALERQIANDLQEKNSESNSDDSTNSTTPEDYSDKKKRKFIEISEFNNEEDASHTWTQNFQNLLEFGETYGHCNVSSNYRVPGSQSSGLGMWLSSQRRRWKKGTLLPERQMKLQKLVDCGVLKWEMHDDESLATLWRRNFDALLAYGEAHGHCNVPQKKKSDSSNVSEAILGRWLHAQRYAQKKGKLQPERERMLQDLVDRGMLYWDLMNEENLDLNWQKNFNELMKFGEKFGHYNVPQKYRVVGSDGPALGVWLDGQRRDKRRGKLKENRFKQLQALVDTGKLRWGLKDASA